jgi:hypothetical protein
MGRFLVFKYENISCKYMIVFLENHGPNDNIEKLRCTKPCWIRILISSIYNVISLETLFVVYKDCLIDLAEAAGSHLAALSFPSGHSPELSIIFVVRDAFRQ